MPNRANSEALADEQFLIFHHELSNRLQKLYEENTYYQSFSTEPLGVRILTEQRPTGQHQIRSHNGENLLLNLNRLTNKRKSTES